MILGFGRMLFIDANWIWKPVCFRRFIKHFQKWKCGFSTQRRFTISGQKRNRERNVFPHAITVFVDNRRLMVATRLIIKCSGSWTIRVFNHPAEGSCRKRPVSPNCRRRQDGGSPVISAAKMAAPHAAVARERDPPGERGPDGQRVAQRLQSPRNDNAQDG